MKTTTKGLCTRTKHILDADKRGQEVVITVRGKPRAIIVALKLGKRVKRKAPLFGIWKDHPDSHDVAAYVDCIRGAR